MRRPQVFRFLLGVEKETIGMNLEAATWGVLWKYVFLKISQDLQENTCVVFDKVVGWVLFSCEFYEIF